MHLLVNICWSIYMMYLSPRSNRSSIHIMPIVLNASCVSISLYILSMLDISRYSFLVTEAYLHLYDVYITQIQTAKHKYHEHLECVMCIYIYVPPDYAWYISFIVFIHMMQSSVSKCIIIDRNYISWKMGNPILLIVNPEDGVALGRSLPLPCTVNP